MQQYCILYYYSNNFHTHPGQVAMQTIEFVLNIFTLSAVGGDICGQRTKCYTPYSPSIVINHEAMKMDVGDRCYRYTKA